MAEKSVDALNLPSHLRATTCLSNDDVPATSLNDAAQSELVEAVTASSALGQEVVATTIGGTAPDTCAAAPSSLDVSASQSHACIRFCERRQNRNVQTSWAKMATDRVRFMLTCVMLI